MIATLGFFAALFLPGYVLARACFGDDRRSGMLGIIAVSYIGTLAILSPISVLCYLLRLPVMAFSLACAIVIGGSTIVILRQRWHRDLLALLKDTPRLALCIVLLDLLIGARVGAFHRGGDERLHVGRVRFLLDHGFSNQDFHLQGDYFLPIYHTNLLHSVFAAASQLANVDYLDAWFISLVWAKLLVAAGYYYMAWSVFQRRWVAWMVALFALGWLGPITFLVYPNKLAPHWVIPTMVGFAAQGCRSANPSLAAVKLALGSLILGQLHSLYGLFAGMAIGPSLLGFGLWDYFRRRHVNWAILACFAALFVASPFALVAEAGRAEPAATAGNGTSVEPGGRFRHFDDGWAMLSVDSLTSLRGTIGVVLGVAGIAVGIVMARGPGLWFLLCAIGTLVVVFFVPPICGKLIELIGQEWIAARMTGLLWTLWLLGAVGGIAVWGERFLGTRYVGPLLCIAVFLAGAFFRTPTGSVSWRKYLSRASASSEKRYSVMNKLRARRALLRKHIPAGSTVLTYRQLERSLIMLHDCYGVSCSRGGGIADVYERKRDHNTMLDPRTSWPRRLEVLREYGISRFVFDRRWASPDWAQWTVGHLTRRPIRQKPITIYYLDTEM